MPLRFKNPFALGVTASLVFVCTLLLLLWLCDVRNDRKHTVNVNAATPIFAGNGGDGVSRAVAAVPLVFGRRGERSR